MDTISTIKPNPTLESPIKNVGIYARVSTAQSKQVNSLSSQVDVLFDIVAKDPFMRLYDVYVDIASGRKDRRNLDRLLRDCEDGKVDYVLVKSVSRMARDTVLLLNYTRRMKDLNVNVHFENGKIETISSNDELVLTITAAYAQAESDWKSVSIRQGIKMAKEDPNSKVNNKAIYGYGKDSDERLYIIPEQAEVVKSIYTMYIEGYSVIKIINALYEKGIPSPSGKPRWTDRSVRLLLAQRKYTGQDLISKLPKMTTIRKNNYPRIIEQYTFDEAQEIAAKRSTHEKDADGNTVRSKTKYSSKRGK